MIEPVFETPLIEGVPAWPWALGPLPPFGWVRLAADASPEVVGLFLAALVQDNAIAIAETAAGVLDAVTNEPDLIISGGLRIIGADGTIIVPGCCAGLESWREWPCAERTERGIRVWADRPDAATSSGKYVDIDGASFRRELVGVQQELAGFLDRVAEWSAAVGYDRPTDLATHLGSAFAIGAPLKFDASMSDG